jgi:hypothetical protein
MSPRPRVLAPRPRGRRLLVAILLAVLAPTSGVLSATTPASRVPTGPPSTLADLPIDPADAAAALVDIVHGPDATLAVEATGELLRRAGIPLVSTAGAVVALPDRAVLADEPVYAPLVAQLAGAVRQGDFYAPDQLAELLAGIEVTNGPLPTSTLIGGLGAWGKGPDDLVESRFAGAAVRALAGIRLEVLYPQAPPAGVRLDPLQVALIVAHGRSDAYERVDATGAQDSVLDRLFGVEVVRAATGPCDDLARALKTDDNTVGGVIEGQIRDRTRDALVDSWKDFVLDEAGKEALETGGKVHEKGAAVVSTLLLLMGATLDLNDDKGGLAHYRHEPGDRGADVEVTARARFESTIAKEKVACYGLAGIEVPPPGPLEGFRVRWSIDQPVGRGYAGKHVVPARDDSRAFLGTGGGGAVTGADGTSKVTLETAVERNPGAGAELEGHVTVTASLDKDDFPFKLSDVVSLGPGFGAKKTWDLVVSAVQRAGLPTERRVIKVSYHGTNIYAAKGETTLFAIYYMLPVYVDIVTCEGLDGRWTGVGGFRGDQTWLAEAANLIFGAGFPADFSGEQQLDFRVPIRDGIGRFDIVPPAFTGLMSIDLEGRQYWQRDFTPVGEVEVLIGGRSADPLALFDGRGARWPIVQLPEHPDCPDGSAYFPS